MEKTEISLLFVLDKYTIGDRDMSGLGIRYLEMCKALTEYQCTILVARNTCSRELLVYLKTFPNIIIKQFNNSCIYKEIDNHKIVFFTDMVEKDFLLYAKSKGKIIISETTVPIEHMDYPEIYRSSSPIRGHKELIANFKLQLKVSDYLISRSQIEHSILISNLILLEEFTIENYITDKHLSKLIYIPIGFSSFFLNEQEKFHDKESLKSLNICWNGGVWDYMNFDWVETFLSKKKHNLYFIHYDVNSKFKAINLLKRQTSSRLHFYNLSFQEKQSFMNDMDLIICFGKDSLENKTCLRLRIRDCLLYNIPIIVDDNGFTADFVKIHGIGRVVKNDEELFDVLEELQNEHNYSSIVANIKKIKSKFCYEKTMEVFKEKVLKINGE